LVDQIGGLEDVLAAIRSQQGQDTMNKQTLQPAAAEEQPAAAAAEVPVTVQEAPTQPDLAAYMTAFGDAEGARMFRDGLDFHAAQASHLQTLQGTIQDLRAELAQLKQQAASMAEAVKGETTPVAIGGTVPRSLAEAFRARKN
jgi:hypothetical protein